MSDTANEESSYENLAQLDAAEQEELTRSAAVFAHQVVAFRRVLLNEDIPPDEVSRYVQAFIIGTMSSSEESSEN